MNQSEKRLSSSFRDPSGFVFQHEGVFYRQINLSHRDDYDALIESGLYDELTKKSLLIDHTEVDRREIEAPEPNCYKLVKPRQLAFISYPYEWCFSQLKDAALLTLRLQAMSLRRGLTLKDASAFNIQFDEGRPVFIDTLSFGLYQEGEPWVAYKQFCQHFLAPLTLIAYRGSEFGKLSTVHIDGIPLDFASRLLPARAKLNHRLFMHLQLHSKMQADFSDSAEDGRDRKARASKLSKKAQLAMLEDLYAAIEKLTWKPSGTEWGDYYTHTNYNDEATNHKKKIVSEFMNAVPTPISVAQDLGANTGEFSRIAAEFAGLVVAQDIDPAAVEANYLRVKSHAPKNIHPLIQDLFAPSPQVGWANAERDSFVQRSKADVTLALALIHHLAISNNVPLGHIASLFAQLSNYLILEFVPKADSQVIRLLKTREDIFPEYDIEHFEEAFGAHFDILRKEHVSNSHRTIYLMKRS